LTLREAQKKHKENHDKCLREALEKKEREWRRLKIQRKQRRLQQRSNLWFENIEHKNHTIGFDKSRDQTQEEDYSELMFPNAMTMVMCFEMSMVKRFKKYCYTPGSGWKLSKRGCISVWQGKSICCMTVDFPSEWNGYIHLPLQHVYSINDVLTAGDYDRREDFEPNSVTSDTSNSTSQARGEQGISSKSCFWSQRSLWHGTTGYECRTRSPRDSTFHRPSILERLCGQSDSNCSSITPNWIWQWFPSSGTSQWVGAVHCEMLVDMHSRISG
jgi:hypothetical protein